MKDLATIASSQPIKEEDAKAAEEIVKSEDTEYDNEIKAMMNDIFVKYENETYFKQEQSIATDDDLEKAKLKLSEAQSNLQATLIQYLKKATGVLDFQNRLKAGIKFMATKGAEFLIASAKPLAFYTTAALGTSLLTVPLPHYPNGLVDWTDPFQDETFDTWAHRMLNIHQTTNIDKADAQLMAVYAGGILGHVGYQIVQATINKKETSLIKSISSIAYTAVWPFMVMSPAALMGRVATLISSLTVPVMSYPITGDDTISGLQQLAIDTCPVGEEELANQLVPVEGGGYDISMMYRLDETGTYVFDPAAGITRTITDKFPVAAQYAAKFVKDNTGAMSTFVYDNFMGPHATPFTVLRGIQSVTDWATGANPGGRGGEFQIPTEVHAVADEVNAVMGMAIYLIESSKATFNQAIRLLSADGVYNMGLMVSGTTSTAAGLLKGSTGAVTVGATTTVIGAIGGFLEFMIDMIRAQ